MADTEESLVAPSLLMKMGPWRYPFFLVDKICEFKRGSRGYITAVKNISFNEPQFTGHFPDSPIMPGVLIAEAMGQTSDYLTLLTAFCEEYEQRFDCDLSERQVADALGRQRKIGDRRPFDVGDIDAAVEQGLQRRSLFDQGLRRRRPGLQRRSGGPRDLFERREPIRQLAVNLGSDQGHR